MASLGRESGSVGLALVAAGGGLGSLLRFGLDRWIGAWPPLGTLAANVLACFLLGLLLYEAHLADRLSPETRLLLGTGFCGSLSTYSTFAAETASLPPLPAATYVAGTYVSGVLAIVAASLLARWRW
jgi:CrcB protein